MVGMEQAEVDVRQVNAIAMRPHEPNDDVRVVTDASDRTWNMVVADNLRREDHAVSAARILWPAVRILDSLGQLDMLKAMTVNLVRRLVRREQRVFDGNEGVNLVPRVVPLAEGRSTIDKSRVGELGQNPIDAVQEIWDEDVVGIQEAGDLVVLLLGEGEQSIEHRGVFVSDMRNVSLSEDFDAFVNVIEAELLSEILSRPLPRNDVHAAGLNASNYPTVKRDAMALPSVIVLQFAKAYEKPNVQFSTH
jgi:hypothetical protein